MYIYICFLVFVGLLNFDAKIGPKTLLFVLFLFVFARGRNQLWSQSPANKSLRKDTGASLGRGLKKKTHLTCSTGLGPADWPDRRGPQSVDGNGSRVRAPPRRPGDLYAVTVQLQEISQLQCACLCSALDGDGRDGLCQWRAGHGQYSSLLSLSPAPALWPHHLSLTSLLLP